MGGGSAASFQMLWLCFHIMLNIIMLSRFYYFVCREFMRPMEYIRKKCCRRLLAPYFRTGHTQQSATPLFWYLAWSQSALDEYNSREITCSSVSSAIMCGFRDDFRRHFECAIIFAFTYYTHHYLNGHLLFMEIVGVCGTHNPANLGAAF